MGLGIRPALFMLNMKQAEKQKYILDFRALGEKIIFKRIFFDIEFEYKAKRNKKNCFSAIIYK